MTPQPVAPVGVLDYSKLSFPTLKKCNHFSNGCLCNEKYIIVIRNLNTPKKTVLKLNTLLERIPKTIMGLLCPKCWQKGDFSMLWLNTTICLPNNALMWTEAQVWTDAWAPTSRVCSTSISSNSPTRRKSHCTHIVAIPQHYIPQRSQVPEKRFRILLHS